MIFVSGKKGNTMNNKTAFNAENYDGRIRKIIPYYDEFYKQIFGVIKAYYGDQKLALLDTGCGTGNYAAIAFEKLNVSEMVLCDPSENMLNTAREKLAGKACEFICAGSESLEFENRFDVVTAIQSHHYFDRKGRKQAVQNCFRALTPGGLFICFENTASFTETGKNITLRRLEEFEAEAGRTEDEIKHHSARYNTEFFPLTISEHLELLKNTGFSAAEVLWVSFMQSGYFAIK